MTDVIAMHAVGHVRGGRADPVDDAWDQVEAEIVLDSARFGPEAAAGLADFSHIEVIYRFDRVDEAKIETGSRHPRGRTDWPKAGIFAQRGKNRPNRIGLTACRLLAVEGLRLRVRGLDAIDGTPVLDIKPVMTGFLPRGAIREPSWAKEIMGAYW